MPCSGARALERYAVPEISGSNGDAYAACLVKRRCSAASRARQPREREDCGLGGVLAHVQSVGKSVVVKGTSVDLRITLQIFLQVQVQRVGKYRKNTPDNLEYTA